MPENENLTDVIKLISDIRHGKVFNSYEIALRTEQLLEKLISEGQWNNARELMQQIKDKIRQVSQSLPLEATATNIMRHILKVIREEFDLGSEKKAEGQSLHQIVTGDQSDELDYSESHGNLRNRLLDHLTEYKVELETSTENIAAQALEHIHTNEIILTVGISNTVEKFLKHAAKQRKFQVIVVEAAPLYRGHKMAASLANSNIQTTVIPDSGVFAMMSRVNKVIIGTHSVMADGGLRAASGVHAIALAAKHYSVPVMVLSHMYKLTPTYVCSHEKDTFNMCASPANVIPYSTGPLLNKITVYNPIFDYVPPELVTLFISHQGGNAPSYVYRLLSELYHPDDYEL
ncbi:translation initiation factor eIF2B subunit beta [Tribolium castaneum]|uniref:Translation initiation factor eIF2B subunit beta n=1 Tax=Tribolium castaneum TaxID=7070 RepID=D7EIS2_TRICA|nr:PREDICTED: translation initiation factor eIF-2B subunit beta [Tribolium castaneum]EFA12261.1 Translation initiation factor eIF-2B subunit beta-like Protein [Tribolium castaneum]|eukprot:XP_967622.1 PREDICTED: translation initiation factor eIF-2B subunit beta [Tribolium castaneum]